MKSDYILYLEENYKAAHGQIFNNFCYSILYIVMIFMLTGVFVVIYVKLKNNEQMYIFGLEQQDFDIQSSTTRKKLRVEQWLNQVEQYQTNMKNANMIALGSQANDDSSMHLDDHNLNQLQNLELD
eukprot:CAMPEP_0116934166 /NCGR_PEP_ID=MMETSP0467-20121206/29479_1 /TAXON_ID=283647 /ORGANISM="Mesodinium pulex, Strain SPMC105" /LENGTH=125 /DNA_ID=CAMNT_0004615203 /DNA_START=662 /DNA_END=1039 /DNA_ORIENTATION=+